MAVLDSLRQSPLFASLGDANLELLAPYFSEVELPSNHVLIQPRSAGAGLFLICDGTVVVEAYELERELGPGEIVGEISLLADHGTRSARVTVHSPFGGPTSSRFCARFPSSERRFKSWPSSGSPSWNPAASSPGQSEPRGHNRAVISPAVDNLVAQLSRLPGVGTRTAQRLAFHLLRAPKDEALALAAAVEEVKERVRFCRECGNLTEDELCAICQDSRRDRTVVCVVEQPVDLISVERTHEYRGLYHVLGGALSPLDGVEPEHLRIGELLGRVERDGIEEVVLATNPNMTGEATAAFLADRLRGRVRVTRLASGLPVGGDLEYADEVTLGRALAGRREMS
jgi:recombination protein RecR